MVSGQGHKSLVVVSVFNFISFASSESVDSLFLSSCVMAGIEDPGVVRIPLNELQEQLTCGKCHKLYTNPKTLSCHHSFCQQCIEGLPTIPTLFVACPTCHHHTELPDYAGSAGLSVAPQVTQLREVYNEAKKQLGIVKCGGCSNPDASGYCKDCNVSLCNECNDGHKRWGPFANHVIISLDEALVDQKAVLSAVIERETEIREQAEEVKGKIRSSVRSVQDNLIREVDRIVASKLQLLEKQKKEIFNASHEVSQCKPIVKADIQFVKSNKSIDHHIGSVVTCTRLECKVKIDIIKHIPKEKAISFELSIVLPDDESLLVIPASSLSLNILPTSNIKPHPVINARVIPTVKPEVYQVICTPVIRGHHQVNVTALGVQLKESSSFTIPFNPYNIHVAPIRTIDGVKRPFGVAVNDDGRIIVSELGANIVSILSNEGNKLKWFGEGNNGITFLFNHGIDISEDGCILVADTNNDRIQKIGMDGMPIKSVGIHGNGTLQFDRPTGVAVSRKKERIYITEFRNHRIQVLNYDLTFCRTFGKEGTGNGEFKNPHDVAIDSEGFVYVADLSNHRIQKFTYDGKYLLQFGVEGSCPGQLKAPAGITTDNTGLVYVIEQGNHRVSVFTGDGVFVSSFGKKGANEDQFNNPIGITLGKDGFLYICDDGNKRLVVY